MLATCVKMRHSLDRLRNLPPRPPFWVGGEYVCIAGEHRLQNAQVSYRLGGADFASFKTGDLIEVLVSEMTAELLSCKEAKRVAAAKVERPRAKPHAVSFPLFVNDLRSILLKLGLTEIFTPTLVSCPGLEPSLEPFATTVTQGSKSREVYLPTSPEIHLKKALARGLHNIFEIKTCFRRGEFSSHHENEFKMLEWYRGFADLDTVIGDLELIIEQLSERGWGRDAEAVQVTDFRTLFAEILGFELRPRTSAQELRELCLELKIETAANDTFTDLFHRLMIEKIEPAMSTRGPLVVRRFPPEMAALAKIDNEGWADRFELYWNGLEIANAFFEVTDPEEQRERWKTEQQERERLGTTKLPQDPEMIRALEMGIPPTGGIALGVERLYMAFEKITDIRELNLFPSADLFD